MLKQSDIEASIGAYERTAQLAIQQAKNVALPPPVRLCFTTLGLTEPRIHELARIITTGRRKEERGSEFIYVFRLSPLNSIPPEEVLKAFNAARAMQELGDYPGQKNLCRPHPLAAGSKALYVGRSYAPRERLKQHLRESASGTYALHFAAWASAIDLQVEFFLYQFSGVGDRVIQVLEDGLWDNLKPMLGRRGEK